MASIRLGVSHWRMLTGIMDVLTGAGIKKLADFCIYSLGAAMVGEILNQGSERHKNPLNAAGYLQSLI